MRYIHLALVLVAVYLPSERDWVLPTLATINFIFAFIFYWLTFELVSGLKSSTLNNDIDVAGSLSSRMIQLTATILLFMTGDDVYIAIAAFSLPWMIINTLTDLFAMLIKWDILAITDKEE